MSQGLISIAWMIVAGAAITALFSPIYFYTRHSERRPDPARRVPILLYLFLLLCGGAIGFFFGMIKGIDWACSGPDPGNLCGLAGVFVTGPLGAAFAIGVAGSLILLLPADAPNNARS